jgi:hypothetical protein
VPATLNIDDIPPGQLGKLGLRKPSGSKFTADQVRGWALKVLGAMANLTREERSRVPRHAAKVNQV